MADIEKLRAEAESLRKKIKVAIAYLTKSVPVPCRLYPIVDLC